MKIVAHEICIHTCLPHLQVFALIFAHVLVSILQHKDGLLKGMLSTSTGYILANQEVQEVSSLQQKEEGPIHKLCSLVAK